MKQGLASKMCVYFICLSFLLLISGFPGAAAEAKERDIPMGEMISKGEVEFEAREDVWKKVESSHFPIFEGVRVKTTKGAALIVLADESQIEVGQNSMFSLHHNDEFHLFGGQISFRIPANAELIVKVGELSVGKPQQIHASKSAIPLSSASEETFGSVILHSNGAVTVSGIRGSLSVQGKDRAVLAAIDSGESFTIPSIQSSGTRGTTIAQAGELPPEEPEEGALSEISTETWIGIGLGGAAVIGGVILIAGADGDGDDEFVVVSPP